MDLLGIKTMVIKRLPLWLTRFVNALTFNPEVEARCLEGCPDVIGEQLLIRCTHGWGWTTHRPNNAPEIFDDEVLAFIMSDGCDYDFSDNIAPAWRVFVGDGELDLETEWFPVLGGEMTIVGYGSVGRDSESLDRSEAYRTTKSEQDADDQAAAAVNSKVA